MVVGPNGGPEADRLRFSSVTWAVAVASSAPAGWWLL
ncbi:hypothetical protein STVIR_4240 [Streptomyces viridochromogenes Tue57]|uniref:Uncharacterized protein n=1 Tax=Streptomyces viridochromogenes Tue57 TaxID=1160705 RepID=L8PFD3_STRVR|nr:hypothetical protein STVIR_4240 [Streptomyces viridochromogenes Tue57]